MRTVILRGSLAAVTGVVLGSALALAFGPQVEDLLFETSARDPLAYGVAIGAVLLMTLAATVLPGLRASRVDPLVALRMD